MTPKRSLCPLFQRHGSMRSIETDDAFGNPVYDMDKLQDVLKCHHLGKTYQVLESSSVRFCYQSSSGDEINIDISVSPYRN